MAAVALGRSRNVRRRFGQGVGEGKAAAVAGSALACGRCVIHLGWPERHKIAVTAIALGSRRNMRSRLAKSRDAVTA